MNQSPYKSLPNLMSELRDKLTQIDNTQSLNEKYNSSYRLPGGTPAKKPAKTNTTTPPNTKTTNTNTPPPNAKPTTPPPSSGTSTIPAVAGAAGAGAAGVALWRQARRTRKTAKPTTTPVPAKPTTGPGRRILNAKPLTIKAALGGLLAGSLGYLFYKPIKDYAG